MSTTQQERWMIIGWKPLLVTGLLLTGALPGSAQQKDVPPSDQRELATQDLAAALSELAEYVRTRDDSGLDDVICNDLRSQVQLLRQTRLGLLQDPEDPQVRLEFQQRHRAEVYLHFEKLALSGRQINQLEISRLHFTDPVTDGPENLQVVSGGNEIAYPITASGIMGVTCQPGDHVFDVAVMQVDGRWCLSVVSP